MRIFVISKKTGIMYALLAVLTLALVCIGRSDTLPVSAVPRDLPIYCVQKSETDKKVAISFDAAWGNEDTATLIDILDKYNVKTTFFVVGGWADKYPESVKQLSDAGHEIMNHSDTHPHMTQLSEEKIREEVAACDDKIEKITGKKPILFRAPYGDYDNKVVGTLRDTGHYTIQWDVDSLDWKNLPSEEIAERVLKKVKSGSIVLFHNAAVNTPEALPVVLEGLQKNGYEIVPVSQLILLDNYTIDSAGMQLPNAENKNDASKKASEEITENADEKSDSGKNNVRNTKDKGMNNAKENTKGDEKSKEKYYDNHSNGGVSA